MHKLPPIRPRNITNIDSNSSINLENETIRQSNGYSLSSVLLKKDDSRQLAESNSHLATMTAQTEQV